MFGCTSGEGMLTFFSYVPKVSDFGERLSMKRDGEATVMVDIRRKYGSSFSQQTHVSKMAFQVVCHKLPSYPTVSGNHSRTSVTIQLLACASTRLISSYSSNEDHISMNPSYLHKHEVPL